MEPPFSFHLVWEEWFNDVPTIQMSWLWVFVMIVAKVIVTVASTFTKLNMEDYMSVLTVMIVGTAGNVLGHFSFLHYQS